MTDLNRAIGLGSALTLMLGGLLLANDTRELEWVDLIPGGELYYQQLEASSGIDEDFWEDFDWEDDGWEDDAWGDESFEEQVATPAYLGFRGRRRT